MKPIRIALTKGRLENKTVELLERLGYDCTNARKKGRKLIMPIGNGSRACEGGRCCYLCRKWCL